jgi:hypothetical protein
MAPETNHLSRELPQPRYFPLHVFLTNWLGLPWFVWAWFGLARGTVGLSICTELAQEVMCSNSSQSFSRIVIF